MCKPVELVIFSAFYLRRYLDTWNLILIFSRSTRQEKFCRLFHHIHSNTVFNFVESWWVLCLKLFCSHYEFVYLRFTANKLCLVTHYTLISLRNYYCYIIIIITQHFKIVWILMHNYAKWCNTHKYAKWCKQNILQVPRFYRKEWKKVALVARVLTVWERCLPLKTRQT